jgi:hypothetical protein
MVKLLLLALYLVWKGRGQPCPYRRICDLAFLTIPPFPDNCYALAYRRDVNSLTEVSDIL